MKKGLLTMAGVLLTVSLVSAGTTVPVLAEEETTLVYGSGDYTRINPAMDEHGEINILIFNGLTAHDGENQVVPGLAESWDFDDETNTYTFHMAEDAKWQDGEPVTAEDVKFTIEAIMDPENGSENAPNYEDVEEINVIDDHTVAFKLEDKNVAFLDYMTMAVLPKHLLEGEDMQTSDYRGIMFNFGNEYWQKNRDLIPAVCYGLDRQAIIDAVILGQGMPAYGPLQRNIYNYEDVEHYDYNPEKAKEILEAAGCEMGDDGFYYRDGEKVGFVISVSAGDQVRIDMAQIAAQELKEIGMDVSVEIPAQTDWAGQMAFLIGWGSPFDADDHTYKVFGTDKGANYSGYSNADVDKYLTEARQSADPEVRAEAYANFQKALAEDPAYAMICYIDANYVADSNIKGIDPDTIMGHHGVGVFWNVADWTIE